MLLLRRTIAEAEFLITQMGEGEMLASVVTRRCFELHGGALRLAPEQPWTVAEPDVDAEVYGAFDAETPFAREGTDVFVLGAARPAAPGGSRGRVEVDVDGAPFARIDVVGDRVWEKRRRALEASAPRPFERIPLTWAHAYGGTVETLTGSLPHHANPKGRGYCLEADRVEGTPLPNLEDPAQPIRTWQDQPTPVALAPAARDWSLRATVGVDLDLDAPNPRVRGIRQAYFNNADPRFVLRPGAREGTRFTLRGVLDGGEELDFRLPDVALWVAITRGERVFGFPLRLDLLVIEPDRRRVVLGQRCTFTYPFVEEERRAAVLLAGDVPDEIGDDVRIDWAAYDAEERLHG